MKNLIIREHLVRKTGKQKKAFRERMISELSSRGIEAREETYKDLMRSVNLIVGDPEKAELFFGAHYDTCPRMPFPNLITPRNQWIYLAYQMGLVLALVAISLAASIPVGLLTNSEMLGEAVWFIVYFGALALMMKGPANPNTFNDNTSGVVGLTELMLRMPPELRDRCCFIYFDNEEVGLLGSGAFRGKHRAQAKSVPMVNMDCIGDGDYLLLAASKAFRRDERLYAAVQRAFTGETALHSPAEKTVYPSDQKKFRKSLALAALKKGPKIGYYMDRIHTPKDTVLEQKNIDRVADGLCAAAKEYLRSA